ncbi:glycosyltransferase family 4 protein [Ramlibacter tataouinensis]|uniref:Undecaprenyl-phosphate N-acetylglucosaminyl 1-phosphate transferase (UDP-GlcNAc:undecaprenyl-P GlcNAc 1-P transferase)-like protein n=1 Tax=Ramlibacter tataouinensis (strain ATCC BAA-407 / DSM 14655 / LMG 21543 / TTB310) TaxID=365046 RepID=F5XYX7_RAMTT|nr:glycosyltransferase [Ramlibacter tataouinensis]AEG91965.1 undecaprenyl-phosphate N-acetylglucosaminyl 1-phosphate transferase (UDP-GlcNAc:undecaprenyl-P GlcNAc 1-P transferase)-like protein [Ramlibacter tataouinensis TTB310]
MLILLVLCGLLSAVGCAVLLRYGRRSARRYSLHMPQRFHAGHVPRLGGAAMIVACTVGWVWMVIAQQWFGVPTGIPYEPMFAFSLWIVATVAAVGGVAEDVSHRLGARWRLGFTLVAGVAAAWLLGLRIDGLGLAAVDRVWDNSRWAPLVLAVFAVAGLPHAFNLIDGYNGLAGIVATICCLALAYVALQVGDRQLAAVVLVLAGATAGFLVWNYPRGLIFAGDGGAYLWGVVIAVTAILLVQRHPQVSPWFPMLLLIYPVWETVFSIYRKLIRGQSPGVADALHFHQLIYRRIVRGVFDEDNEARRMLMRNNRTSPYLWGFTILTVVPAVLFWQNTYVLMAFCLLFVISYIYAYVSIVRFKVPRWVKR